MPGLGRGKGTDRAKGLTMVLLGGSGTKNALVRWLFIC